MLLWSEIEESRRMMKKPEQIELADIVDPIDDKEAFFRHKQTMAMRWFGYYRKCQEENKKMKLIDQYNFLAQTKQR